MVQNIMTHEVKENLIDIGKSAVAGGGLSGGMASFWPEALHGFAVFFTGVITSIAVFFVNRYLKRKFPEEK